MIIILLLLPVIFFVSHYKFFSDGLMWFNLNAITSLCSLCSALHYATVCTHCLGRARWWRRALLGALTRHTHTRTHTQVVVGSLYTVQTPATTRTHTHTLTSAVYWFFPLILIHYFSLWYLSYCTLLFNVYLLFVYFSSSFNWIMTAMVVTTCKVIIIRYKEKPHV